MNKQLLFVKRPIGEADEDTWNLVSNPIPEPKEGEVLIQQHYISLDPAMRGWMNNAKSYIEPMAIGSVMRAGSVGKVIKSNNHPKFKEGDFVSGNGGVQQYTVTDGKGYYPVDPNLAPLPTYIGTLGMPGMTAYFGILEVGKIKEGDVVLVSGAAGAVGSVVGQIAKIKGCTVVGIAGGAQKCEYLVNELGFDGAIDYKNENVRDRLKELCPKGIDVYFDNVGGDILAWLTRTVKPWGSIASVGLAGGAHLNTTVMPFILRGVSLIGISSSLCPTHYRQPLWDRLASDLAPKHMEQIVTNTIGLDGLSDVFDKMLAGNTIGRTVVAINPDL